MAGTQSNKYVGARNIRDDTRLPQQRRVLRTPLRAPIEAWNFRQCLLENVLEQS